MFGPSERQAGDKHVLDDRRRRHKVFEFQVEDALQALDAQAAQVRQLGQQPREVVWLLLGLAVVRHVVPQ